MPTSSPVFLRDVASGDMVEAELWDAITERNVSDWHSEWTPYLLQALQRLHRSGDLSRWPQSWRWNWRDKADAVEKLLAWSGASIVCAGVTQGMMVVDTASKRCKLQTQKGLDLVYVEFIENAPWNRAELTGDDPRYRGTGTLLVRAAVAMSEELDFKGRIGLHSLKRAESFYKGTCGMTDLGADQAYGGLHYFEATPAQARAFAQQGGDRP